MNADACASIHTINWHPINRSFTLQIVLLTPPPICRRRLINRNLFSLSSGRTGEKEKQKEREREREREREGGRIGAFLIPSPRRVDREKTQKLRTTQCSPFNWETSNSKVIAN